jgi:hypothetical protein
VDYEGKNVTLKLDIPGHASMLSKGILPREPEASNRNKFTKTYASSLLMTAKRNLGGGYDDATERGTALLVTLLPRGAVVPWSFAA